MCAVCVLQFFRNGYVTREDTWYSNSTTCCCSVVSTWLYVQWWPCCFFERSRWLEQALNCWLSKPPRERKEGGRGCEGRVKESSSRELWSSQSVDVSSIRTEFSIELWIHHLQLMPTPAPKDSAISFEGTAWDIEFQNHGLTRENIRTVLTVFNGTATTDGYCASRCAWSRTSATWAMMSIGTRSSSSPSRECKNLVLCFVEYTQRRSQEPGFERLPSCVIHDNVIAVYYTSRGCFGFKHRAAEQGTKSHLRKSWGSARCDC